MTEKTRRVLLKTLDIVKEVVSMLSKMMVTQLRKILNMSLRTNSNLRLCGEMIRSEIRAQTLVLRILRI
jgi:signal transduction protein with GAF and PtsI domain